MAQPSTTYKFELNLTDLDRSIYETVKQTIARHPSETEERMTVRLLAYAFWYNEHLSFGRGLSDVDEPALWEKSLDDRVLHWIEVGQPDADRLTLVLASHRTHQPAGLRQLARLGNQSDPCHQKPEKRAHCCRAAGRPGNPGQQERYATGNPEVQDVMISEGDDFHVTDDRGQHESPVAMVEWRERG